jgi:FkbM family methyltransferase
MLLKRLASHLPFSARQTLRAWKYRLQAAFGRFRSDEPEFHQLPDLVQVGDWVLDVGANVGQYTLRLSELVGNEGRVIAFEPMVETAEILTAMASHARYRNVTVLNIAVSERAGLLRFGVPTGATGLPNYFQARVSGDGDRLIPCFALDELPFAHRVALIKIDVEQHEVPVIRGMGKLIERDHPILIIEGHSGIYPEFLAAYGYAMRPKAAGSCNLVFMPGAGPGRASL